MGDAVRPVSGEPGAASEGVPAWGAREEAPGIESGIGACLASTERAAEPARREVDDAPLGQGEDGSGDAALYPAKDVVLPFMKERYETIIGVLPDVPASVFSAPNPMEGKFAEMLPTRGDAVSFMMNNHIMMHAGQVSFWRRAMGMGSLNP